MTNLQDIIQLCQNEQGKVFVTDEKGNVTLVILGIDQYQAMRQGKSSVAIRDIEEINRKIIQAQLDEDKSAQPAATVIPKITSVPPVVKQDLREEVIDPSFDFDSTDDL